MADQTCAHGGCNCKVEQGKGVSKTAIYTALIIVRMLARLLQASANVDIRAATRINIRDGGLSAIPFSGGNASNALGQNASPTIGFVTNVEIESAFLVGRRQHEEIISPFGLSISACLYGGFPLTLYG
jgi:hypothetical protein